MTDGEAPRGAGVLLQTTVDRVDLGEHHGRRLVALVEHRTLRLAAGRWGTGSLTLGRRRARRLEVSDGASHEGRNDEPAAERYDVVIPAPPDPWPRYLRRVAALAGACWVLVTLARRMRQDRGEHEAA